MKTIEEKLDALSRQVAQAEVSQVRRVVDAAYKLGQENATAPDSIQEALNSGDGVYRP